MNQKGANNTFMFVLNFNTHGVLNLNLKYLTRHIRHKFISIHIITLHLANNKQKH